MPAVENPAEIIEIETVPATEKKRILQAARALVLAIYAHHLVEKGKQVSENCPFVFFDWQSEKFILGDVFLKTTKTKKPALYHEFGTILIQTPEIKKAAAVIDDVIGNQEEDMVYFIDKETRDALAGLEGTTIEGGEISLEGTLQRPTGIMPFVLPKEIRAMSGPDMPALAISF
ncbi:hypothetical protein L6272_04535 [Microgenomates group bacterium]|nr:hypothetical protein [Microgenomates group bacterium]